MSSFVRRTKVATIAFGVVAGSFAMATPAFAAGSAGILVTAATPTESPSPATPAPPAGEPSPSTDPAASATPDDGGATPATPAATPSKSEFAGDEQIVFALTGFAPSAPVTATFVGGPFTTPQPVALPAEGSSTDAQGGLQGTLGGDGGALAPGEYTVTFSQESGQTASFTVTIVSSGDDNDDAQPPAGPVAQATDPAFRPDEKVTYTVTGFTPQSVVHVEVTMPDGTTLRAETDGAMTDASGAYAGELEYSTASFPLGNYSARVFLDDGTEATFTFQVTEDGEPSADDDGDDRDSSAGGGTSDPAAGSTGNGSGGSGKELATTGAQDAFGPAGLGLLLAGVGAAAFIGHRLVARRAQ